MRVRVLVSTSGYTIYEGEIPDEITDDIDRRDYFYTHYFETGEFQEVDDESTAWEVESIEEIVLTEQAQEVL